MFIYRRSLRMVETGLMSKWMLHSNLYPEKCNQFRKNHGDLNAYGGKTSPTRLRLSHLIGPFLILSIVYLTALLMLGVEIIFHSLANLIFAIQQISRQSNALAFF